MDLFRKLTHKLYDLKQVEVAIYYVESYMYYVFRILTFHCNLVNQIAIWQLSELQFDDEEFGVLLSDF